MPTEIDRDDAQRLLKSGAQLLDVLPPPEYGQQHLAGAINIPLKQLNRETTAQLERDAPVVVYCYDTA